MRTPQIVTLAVLLALGATSAFAQGGPLQVVHEAVAEQLDLPSNVNGELALRACTACKVLRLRADASTRYFIGEGEVSLVEFTKFAAGHPMGLVTVSHPKQEQTVTRVVVSATAPAK